MFLQLLKFVGTTSIDYNVIRQPAGFLLSRRRPQIFGLAEFKPKLLQAGRKFILSRLGGLPSLLDGPTTGANTFAGPIGKLLPDVLNYPVIRYKRFNR